MNVANVFMATASCGGVVDSGIVSNVRVLIMKRGGFFEWLGFMFRLWRYRTRA